MKISYRWLQDYVDVDILGLETGELASTLTMVGLAVDLVERVEDDVVFDLDVTSNRPDCLNHLGVAREIAAHYRLQLRKPDFRTPPQEAVSGREFPAAVRIESPRLCPRYAARVMTGFRIDESPLWLKKRLEAVGQRPINNLVDITNYVLFATGHPLHAFDYEKLTDRTIVVREAQAGENLVTLDGMERELEPGMTVICDTENPVALAGIMGGEESEISADTETLLLESAYFNPSSIRFTARRLGMNTEASYRFERGADPEMPVRALNLACRLIREICGGRCVSPVLDENPLPYEPRSLRLRGKRIRQVLGVDVDREDAFEILRSLEFSPEKSGENSLEVRVPGFRPDVAQEDDLVEEVARHYGYDRIPATYPHASTLGSYPSSELKERVLVDRLTGFGFYEAMNYVFTNPDREARFMGVEPPMVRVANPLSEIGTHLRTSLVPGLVHSVRYNLNHGNRNIRLFEIGKGYFPETPEVDRVDERLFLCFAAMGEFENPYWSRERENFRFAHLKGITLRLLESLGWEPEFTPTQNCPYLHPGVAAEVTGSGRILGCIGELKPEIAETLKFADSLYLAEIRLDILFEKPLPQPQFKSLPRFPSVQRDFSFLLDRSIEYARIEKVVQELKISELSDFRLIDLYQDPNLSQDKYSLTVRLTFSSPDRTLTQEEVNDRFEKVSGVLCREIGIEPR